MKINYKDKRYFEIKLKEKKRNKLMHELEGMRTTTEFVMEQQYPALYELLGLLESIA